MPDKVWFSTTNWNNKERPAEGYFSPEGKQAEWDAYNSSKFNGFPFPTIEKNQNNGAFEEWDGQTRFEGRPSGSEEYKVSVLGKHYSYKFTYDQLFKLFWRMKKSKIRLESPYFNVQSESSDHRERMFTLDIDNQELGAIAETIQKIDESKLITELNTNKWRVVINGCVVEINFNEPVLKLGEDDYRVFVSCNCCSEPPECCMYPAQALIDGLYTVDDLPDEVLFNDGSRPPTILQKTLNPELVGGVGYPWPEDGSDDAGIYFIVISDGSDPMAWAFGDDRGEGSFTCLIQGDGNLTPNNNLSEDQFADTYTVTDLPNPLPGQQSISVTVSRTSICVWEGLDGCGRPWYLIYGDSIFGTGSAYKWQVAMAIDESEPCQDFVQHPQEKNFDEFNNTPIGNYTQADYPATVS